MAIVFPVAPPIGTLYPVDPGVSGVTQYIWQGSYWNAVTPSVSLGNPNQGAYNSYQWPLLDGLPDQQLTTDGSGNLLWDVPSSPSLQILSLLEPFNGISIAFTLVETGGTVPFSPNPSNNIVVFLGGVPQIPAAAYTVSTNTITFTEAPVPGTTFFAISNVIV